MGDAPCTCETMSRRPEEETDRMRQAGVLVYECDTCHKRHYMKQKAREVRYPEITVKLIGMDGNAFAIGAAVQDALKKGNVPKADRDLYFQEAFSGDYDHLLQVTLRWVNVE